MDWSPLQAHRGRQLGGSWRRRRDPGGHHGGGDRRGHEVLRPLQGVANRVLLELQRVGRLAVQAVGRQQGASCTDTPPRHSHAPSAQRQSANQPSYLRPPDVPPPRSIGHTLSFRVSTRGTRVSSRLEG
eukprot:1195004-Prorocentrum_minimum.AAC.2